MCEDISEDLALVGKVELTTERHQSELCEGPLFIVGMPRSGTKLLRSLVNQHSCIRIGSIETNFLPMWVANWSKYGDLSRQREFARFYNNMIKFPYFLYKKNEGLLIQTNDWYRQCENFTPSGVFEALIRHDIAAVKHSGIIWGDKSPGYAEHIRMLKNLFPEAKFLNIVRDVRDYCLSCHKAWHSHMIRAAQRWADHVETPHKVSTTLPSDCYHELTYENLLNNPERELKKICAFLNLEYEQSMIHLREATEKVGDACGVIGIKQDNAKKYQKLMMPGMKHRIERVAVSGLRFYGYPVDYKGPPIRTSRIAMVAYWINDGMNHLRTGVRSRGFFDAMRFSWRFFLMRFLGRNKSN